MTILDKVSKFQTMKYEEGLSNLVVEIVLSNNQEIVDVILNELMNTKNKSVQSNYIKLLYEIGREDADLINPYTKEFIFLLSSKNNRVVWGAMYALAAMTYLDEMVNYMFEIVDAINEGSRITYDAGIKVLVNITNKFKHVGFSELKLKLLECDAKKLAAYVEETIICNDEEVRNEVINIIDKRISEFSKASQIKRLEKTKKILMK